MAFTQHNENGCVYMTSDKISARHMFTTRHGGVSEGVWASWNLGENRGDEPEAVRENYRRLGELFGVGADDLVVTKQVHGVNVPYVTEKDKHVIGTEIAEGIDGLVTDVKGLPLMIYVADCVPVLLHDERAGVIAAVHCGWKGSVADILGVAVGRMRSLGAKAEDIRAAIGASIGKCCFETDADVPQAVEKYLSGDTDGLITDDGNGKYHVDLRGANERRLLQLGLRPENIDVSDECTVCDQEKYWSHRGMGTVRGSMAAVIML